MAAYVSGLYERAKAEAVWNLYQACRAYEFWALAPADFSGRVGRNPQGLDATQLQAALHDIRNSLIRTLEARRDYTPPVPFPSYDTNFGRIVVLTRDAHGPLFDDLQYGSADFEILPATKKSPAPHADFDPTFTVIRLPGEAPAEAERWPNPFYGMTNVRLSKVRAWMVGMNTGEARHYVQMWHMGKERFRTPTDEPYPPPTNGGPAYACHEEPTRITFAYDSRRLRFDPVKKTLTPGSLTSKDIPGLEDGNLNLRIDPAAKLPLQCEYAPIGPFAHWRLIIDPEKNGQSELSLKDLNMIVIDFHGIHQTFS
jgi:hypothetical protein